MRYSESDLGLIRSAYNTAVLLFANMMRPCGRTFLNHLVSTASILAAHKAPVPLVMAGLLHAAYTHSALCTDSCDGQKNCRALLRQRVGEYTEQLVAAYANFRADNAALLHFDRNEPNLDDVEYSILWLFMANELDERLDNGILFCSKRNDDIARWLPLLGRVARKAGVDGLATELRAAYENSEANSIPEILKSSRRRSFVVDRQIGSPEQ